MTDKQIEELAQCIAQSVHGKCETCKAKGICDRYTPLEGPYDCAKSWELFIKKYILNNEK